MWDLIVSVPDHCLSFYFGGYSIIPRHLLCGGVLKIQISEALNQDIFHH